MRDESETGLAGSGQRGSSQLGFGQLGSGQSGSGQRDSSIAGSSLTDSSLTGSSLPSSSLTSSRLSRRYPVALVLYGFLAVLVWFTLGKGTALVLGRPVEIRVIPLVVIASFVLRTVLARQADRIRRDKE